MSRRNKLQKFADLYAFPHVYESFDLQGSELLGENGTPCQMQGKWLENHFNNTNPVVLELACGRGEYTIAMARRYPDKNVIGVDIKGARIWKGARIALQEQLQNAAFLRTRIERLAWFFDVDEVSEIWITFPDPFLRKSKANRRLTAPGFIKIYRKILVRNGLVHLKTDAQELYDYTLETLQHDPAATVHYHNPDIYSAPLEFSELEIKTRYELAHLAEHKTIKYIRFTIH